MPDPTEIQVLKRDVFGVIERCLDERPACIRRVACGSRLPGSRLLAVWLLRRERRALEALRGLRGVPVLLERDQPEAAGRPLRAATLVRSWIPGEPLHAAPRLPADFFTLLAGLVAELHRRGVCHNDLHKENNIVVGPDGRPALIDFQLASVHRRGGRLFSARCREDLRHVAKHRLRYERRGKVAPGDLPPRGQVATLWAKLVKPGWRRLRRLLRQQDAEPRRPRTGPWPEWTAPVGRGD
jgi:hypothetical protein